MSVNPNFFGSSILGRTQAQQYVSPQLFGSTQNAVQAEAAMMFGPPRTTPVSQYGDDVSRTHLDLFEAYEGSNLHLADTIVGFVLMTPDFSLVVLPPLQTNAMTIEWNVYEFNNLLAQPTPYEGTSRLVSAKKHANRASVSRYGIAFAMEGDMVGSPEGRTAYTRNLQMMSMACLETVHYHTIYALLNCKNALIHRADQLRMAESTSTTLANLEAAEFAALAFDPNVFVRTIERHAAVMRRDRFDPDTLIVFPGFSWTQEVVAQPMYTEYWVFGPGGTQVLVPGPVAPGRFRGMPVYESREFGLQTSGGVLPLQPLSQRVSVGEFYPMTFENLRGVPLDASYETRWRGVAVYDFDRDDYRVVSFVDALFHSRIFGGNPMEPDGLAPQTDVLAQRINASYRDGSGNLEDDIRIYSDLESLENTSHSRAPRRHYMFLSHLPDAQIVQKVKKFSEFDIDVLPTSDLLQMANSLKSRIFSMRGECGQETLCGIEDLFDVLRTFEEAEYNEAFFRALINENIDRSINENEEFVGFRVNDTQSPDWYPNAYGGLDLPLKTDAWPVVPPGLGSWNMLVTYVNQAEARGYGNEAQNPTLARAKRAVRSVRQLHKTLNSLAGASGGLKTSAGPEWIHALKSEAAVFNGLYLSRPPVFLATLSGQQAQPRDRNLATVAVDLPRAWGGDWMNITAATRSSLLSAISGASTAAELRARLAVRTPADNSVLLNASKGPADLQKEFLPKYVAGLWKLASVHGNLPARAIESKLLFEEKLKESEAILAETDSLTPDQTKRILALLAAAAKRGKAAPKAVSAEDEELGLLLIQTYPTATNSNTTPNTSIVNSEGAGRRSDAAGVARVAYHFFEAMPEATQHSRTVIMQALEEELEFNSVILASALGVSRSQVGAYEFLEQAGIQAGAPVAAELNAFSASKAALQSVITAFEQDWQAHLRQSGLLSGNDVAVERAVSNGDVIDHFRSPLAMSPALLTSLGAQKGDRLPLILPANPSDHYRTKVLPDAGDSMQWLLPVKSDVSMGEMIGSKVPLGPDRLKAQPLFRSKMHAPSWKNPYAGSRVARSGKAFNDGFGIGLVKTAAGRVELEDPLVISQRVNAANELRARMGMDARVNIELELAQAEEQRSELERALKSEETRAALLRQFSTATMKSGNNSLQGGAFGRTLYNTALYDESQGYPAGRAAALQQRYPYRSGVYAGEMDGGVSSQYLVNRGNDLYVAPQMAAGARTIRDENGQLFNLVPVDEDGRADESNALQETDASNEAAHPNSIHRYNKINLIEDPILRLLTMVILELPVSSTTFLTLAEANVHVPINFILWRLNIEFSMWSIIMMRAGIETGANMIGPSNLVFSNSAADKMLLGHFTFHNAPVVFNHRGVSILRNVFPREYHAGWNTTWLQTAADLREPVRGSLIASPIAITESVEFARISFTDNTAPLTNMHLTNRPNVRATLPDHSSAAFNEEMWGFSQAGVFKDATQENYFSVELKINARASAGKHFTYDRMRGSYSVCHPGSSPLSGNRTGPRCAPIWNGVPGLFPSQEAFDADSRIQ